CHNDSIDTVKLIEQAVSRKNVIRSFDKHA
ncbi:MAG: hypothetical protein ACI8ZV_002122, partial [Chitinophagales bacterium]